MSTHCNIGLMKSDGTIESVLCLYDGYLTGVGLKLLKYYPNVDNIKNLISLGIISSLREDMDKHDGMPGAKADKDEDIEEFIRECKNGYVDYVYLYDKDIHKWYCNYNDSGIEDKMLDLKEEVIKKQSECFNYQNGFKGTLNMSVKALEDLDDSLRYCLKLYSHHPTMENYYRTVGVIDFLEAMHIIHPQQASNYKFFVDYYQKAQSI